MKETGGAAAYVGVGILALFLIFVIIKMFVGMRQGFWRQLVRTARSVAAAILSFTIASLISGGIIGAFGGMSFDEIVEKLGKFNFSITDKLGAIINCISPEALEYLLLLPAAVIIVPLVFLVLFLVINNILKIASSIIIKTFGFEKATSSPSRLGGALLAGVEAVLIFMIIVMPAASVLNIIDSSYAIVFEEKANREDAAIIEQYETGFLPFVSNPAIDFADKLGGGRIAGSFATVKVKDKRVDVRDDIVEIVHIALVEGPALKGASLGSPTAENKAAISSILDTIESSPFLSGIFVGFINGAADAIDSGIIPINFGEYSDVLDGVVGYLKGFSTEGLGRDMNTAKNLYFTLTDSGVLTAIKDGGDVMSILEQKRKEGNDVVSKIIDILRQNERTMSLMTAVTKAMISNLSTSVTVGDGSVELTYDSIKDAMQDVISVKKEDFDNVEEYKEELTSTLDTVLRDHGIELEGEIVDGIADHIDENYSDVVGKLTDEQFSDILLEYYDVYLDYTQNGVLPDGIPDDLKDYLP